MGDPIAFETARHHYRLYGRQICSEYPMPLPAVAERNPDITIHFTGFKPKSLSQSPNPSAREWVESNGRYFLRFYNHQGHTLEFRFSNNGKHVDISQSWPEWQDSLFALMNPAMAAAISLQGGTVLHGSSLIYNNQSILISGVSEAGKSTLSAALAAEGFSLHSDDLGVVTHNNKQFGIAPGYDRIKIHPEVLEILNLKSLTLHPVTTSIADEVEKWLCADDLPGGFYSQSAPLAAILVLNRRSKQFNLPETELLSPLQAGVALTRHLYGNEWLNPPGASTLSVCSQLATAVPVYRITMPDDLTRLTPSARILLSEVIKPVTDQS